MQPTPRSRAGFKLLELIIVVSVLVLLTGVLVPAVRNSSSKAHNSRVSTDLDGVARAFHAYYVDTGIWPADGVFDAEQDLGGELTGLPCLYRNVHDLVGWAGPYLRRGYRLDPMTTVIAIPGRGPGGGLRDPWGNNYGICYVSRTSADGNGAILLYSKGPNGTLNTSAANLRAGRLDGDDLALAVTRSL